MVATLVGAFPRECRDTALNLVGRTSGLSKWGVWALLYGRRKTVAHETMRALRRAYLDLVGRQLSKLKAELEAAEMRSTEDDAFADIGREAAALVERLRQARQRQR